MEAQALINGDKLHIQVKFDKPVNRPYGLSWYFYIGYANATQLSQFFTGKEPSLNSGEKKYTPVNIDIDEDTLLIRTIDQSVSIKLRDSKAAEAFRSALNIQEEEE